MSNWIKVTQIWFGSSVGCNDEEETCLINLAPYDRCHELSAHPGYVELIGKEVGGIAIKATLDEILEKINKGRPGSGTKVPPYSGVPQGCPEAGSCCGCKDNPPLDPKLKEYKESKDSNTTTNSGCKTPVKAIPVAYQMLADDFANHFSSSTGRDWSYADKTRWGREFMVLAQRLNVDVPRIKDVMAWIYNDVFWSANVQGVQNLYKLRNGVRKWDNIVAKMNQGGVASFIDEELRRGSN